ncbi:MAG: DUF4249 domain-containing protein [Runella slithyformis]|nr:MAG: DUF4249 domain-containing protein [Runella slithyformis]TAF01188.1 MAG: DUF4249 domain-containing protein [Runella slithyformis]TAF24890.1 MAG: DUF4249 domain-containing protein [Runella slithyformis]TAF49704.1 MAG: DUF4249 domain-containing protein [Runella slithyformis]
MLRFVKISVVIALLLSFESCIEPYDVRYNLSTDVLTVDGLVTDQGGSVIAIKRSRSESFIYTVPVKGCTVDILTGDGKKTNLKETAPGIYATPADFRGMLGQTYQLLFKTPEGQNYQSSVELMQAAPDIKKVYQEFNQRGILDRMGTRVLSSTFDIFVDFDDRADQKNAYLWKWELFEAQEICITCEKGILNSRTLQCVNASTPFAYDYQCQGNCWDLFYSTDINIMSDVFSNGRTITGRRVAQVPYYSDLGALVEVQQYAVSNEAYQYYLLLRDQTQTTGTLADTPPAPIVGNVRNINDRSEIVVGYFGAAGVKKMRYWVNRNGFSQQGGVKTPLLGRATNLEPTTPPAPPTFETRPPLYPCIASRNRTPIRPQGWR